MFLSPNFIIYRENHLFMLTYFYALYFVFYFSNLYFLMNFFCPVYKFYKYGPPYINVLFYKISTYTKVLIVSFSSFWINPHKTCHHFSKLPKIVGTRHRHDLMQTFDKNSEKTDAIRLLTVEYSQVSRT